MFYKTRDTEILKLIEARLRQEILLLKFMFCLFLPPFPFSHTESMSVTLLVSYASIVEKIIIECRESPLTDRFSTCNPEISMDLDFFYLVSCRLPANYHNCFFALLRSFFLK